MLNFFFFIFHLDDQEPNPETLLSRSIVSEFYTETAKLKSLGVLHKVLQYAAYLITFASNKVYHVMSVKNYTVLVMILYSLNEHAFYCPTL